MPAGAASSCALPWTLVSRPVSRQSRPKTCVFSGKTGGFVVEVEGFELGDVRIVVALYIQTSGRMPVDGNPLTSASSRRAPKSNRFSSRASRQNTGVSHVPSRAELASEEAVGFELVVR
jgi:hypothetical protein